MLPGAFLVEKYNGKWVLFTSLLLCTLCTLLIPTAARYGDKSGLVAVRIIQGLSQGPILPGIMALCSQWIPSKERSRGVTIVFGGINP